MKTIRKVKKILKEWAKKALFVFTIFSLVFFQPGGIMVAIAQDNASSPSAEESVSKEDASPKEEEEKNDTEVKEETKDDLKEEIVDEDKEELIQEVKEEAENTEITEITGEGQITPEAASIVAPEKEVTIEEGSNKDAKEEELKKDIWSKDGDKETTTEDVKLNEKYVAPQNEEVSVTFTKLPENSGKLSIEEITLTDEQVASLGALSNKAYDITSDMEDGTFEYDLTLPKPANRDDVQIKYAEEKSQLEDAKTVSKDDTKIEYEKISANLDHFTIYFVVGNEANLTVVPTFDHATSVTVAPRTVISVTLNVATNSSGGTDNDWEYSAYRIGSVGVFTNVDTNNHTSSGTNSESFNITAPAISGTYDVSFRACNNVNCTGGSSAYAEKTLTAGIIVEESCESTSVYTKSSDFSDSKVNINFSSGNTVISVSAGSGYEVTKVELDVNGDGYGGFYAYATGPVDNFNPPGGNIDNARVEVTKVCEVSDTTPPTLNLPVNITTEATSSSGAVVSFSATATDTAPASPVVTCVLPSGSTFPIGTTIVICSATDTAGNTASGSFTVKVQDATPPVISGMPANINTKTTDPIGKIVTYANPTANDVVDGAVEVNCTPTSGSTFPVGTTIVTCSASDAAENSSSKSFNVTVGMATGTIKVVKDLHSNLGFDSGRFNLLIDEIVKGTNKGDNGTTGAQTVIAGTHSVSEEGYSTTNLSDYTSSIRCTRQEIDYCHYGHCHYETVEVSSGQGTSLSEINVGEDEDVTCTIQNTRNTGTIKVVKNLNPSDDEGRFNLKIDGDIERLLAGDGDSTWEKTVKVGTHSVSESGSGAWWWGHWHPATSLSNYFSSIECKNGDAIVASGVGTSLSDIAVNKDENIICTITNTRFGSINVHKFNDLNNNGENDDEPSLENWQMGVYSGSDCQGQVISEGMKYTNSEGNALFENLLPGDYSIKEENIPNDWRDTTGVCQNKRITAGENANVEVGNVELSTIHGVKWNDVDGDGEKDEAESLLSGWAINLYKSNGEGYDSEPTQTMNTSNDQHFGWYWFEDLIPGEYKVCETQQTGWRQTFPSESSCYTINLPDGNSYGFQESENYVSGPEYNFGNQQLGKITIIKRVDHDTSRNFPFTSSFAGAFNLGQDDAWTSEFLVPGTYSVSEGSLHSDHWSFDKIRCADSTGLATFVKSKKKVTITLASGSNVTCKYDNDYSRNEDENNNNEDENIVIFSGGTTQPGQETPTTPSEETTPGGQVEGAQNNPEIAGAEKSCEEWPLWVWILMLLAYLGIISFSSFYKLKEDKNLRWVRQVVELAVILFIWYFYEACRLYKWFPWTAVIGGVAVYALYLIMRKKFYSKVK